MTLSTVLSEPLRAALRTRVDVGLDLPLFPETASRVTAACQDENVDLEQLAHLIAHDQSLAAHVLRLSNSAAHAPREPILSVHQAINRLGSSAIREIAIAVALKERLFQVQGYEPRLRELWLQSIATASFAREIAQFLRRNLESSFLCGLLHDVGMPIVMQLVCDLERERVVDRVTPEAMEAAMAAFHCELGAKLVQRWHLGPWIGTVVRSHHDPSSASLLQDEVLVIALADALAYWALHEAAKERDFAAEHPHAQALNISPGALSLQDIEGVISGAFPVHTVSEGAGMALNHVLKHVRTEIKKAG